MYFLVTVLAVTWVIIAKIPIRFFEKKFQKEYVGWIGFFLIHFPLLIWLARSSKTNIVFLLPGASWALFLGFFLGMFLVLWKYRSEEERKELFCKKTRKAAYTILVLIGFTIALEIIVAGNVWFLIGFGIVNLSIGMFLGTLLYVKLDNPNHTKEVI
jgi:hypothetical protein